MAISREVSASPEVAHSLGDPVIHNRRRRKAGVQSMPWLPASQVTGSPACAGPSGKASRPVERLLVAQHVVTGTREFVGHGLECDDPVGRALLAFIETLCRRALP